MTILVVEDESRVLSFISEALKKEGYVVHCASTFEATHDQAEALGDSLDAIVMDRMLGPHDAINLIPSLRQDCPNAKILVLSAINEPTQKAAALDLGADDYLGKPFQLVELSARIRSLTRRTAARGPERQRHVYASQNLKLDVLERKVIVGERSVDLSNKEYLVLFALIQHTGRVFNRFQLLDRVWDTQFDVESNVVEVTIKNLRRKLESAGCTAEIMSRRNIGYWLEA